MKSLASYFVYKFKRSYVQFAMCLALPLLIPYIVYAILMIFVDKPDSIGIESVEVPLLPEQTEFPDYDSDFRYFGYVRDSEVTRDLVKELIQVNGLKHVRPMEFESRDEAFKYFNVKNIVLNDENVDEELAKSIFCKDFEKFRWNTEQCDASFISRRRETYKVKYGITDEDFESDPDGYRDSVFLFLDVLIERNDTTNALLNVTVNMHHNTTMLDNLIIVAPDELSKTYGNVYKQPFWTGYSLTLEKEIDEFMVKRFTGKQYTLTFSHLDEIPFMGQGMTVLMFFEMSLLLSWSVLLVFATLYASENRSDQHVVLRRLGITEGQFWIQNWIFTFLPIYVSTLCCTIIWHCTGVLPYSGVSIGFCLIVQLVFALQLTCIGCFISVVLGMSKSGPVLISCIFGYIFFFIPAMFHAGVFQGTSLFDPSIVPQWGTWFSMALCPIFAVFGLMDAMTSGLPESLRSIEFADYKWQAQSNTVPVAYLFEDYQKYSTIMRFCSISDSKNGAQLHGKCIYYVPIYGWVLLLNALQSLVLLPLLINFIAYVKVEKGNRGLPWGYLFNRKYWNSKRIKPLRGGLTMRNICVAYSQKVKKGDLSNHYSKMFKTRNFVLQGFDLDLQENQISALVGESNQGKSTVLNVLAGEQALFDPQNFAKKHKYNQTAIDIHTTFSEIKKTNDRDKMLSWLSQLPAPECQLFGNINILDPYDAYFIKPYIGYCPQDFSNVWMGVSVYDNVRLSLNIRLEATGTTVENQQQYIQDILKMAGLGDTVVQRRKAKNLSGGMLRRLAFCNAMVGSQHLLLLDEISAGVDPVIKRQIWRMLRCIKGSAILTSHDMLEIGEMTQTLSVLNDGHTVVNNVDQFDLRKGYELYNITLYKGKHMVAEEDYKMLVQFIGVPASLDQLQEHIMKLSIKEKISTEQLLDVCSRLDVFVQKTQFDDYNIDKSSLSDIYIDLIKYEKSGELVTEMAELEDKRSSKLATLLWKSYLFDFSGTKFPVIFVLSLIGVVIAIMSRVLYSLFSSVMQDSNDMLLQSSRYNDIAIDCFDECIEENEGKTAMDKIYNCFLNRQPSYLFDGAPYDSYCSAYLSYIGLDQNEVNLMYSGDRNVLLLRHGFGFAIVEDANTQILDGYEQTFDSEYCLEKNMANVEFDYRELYEDEHAYDPLEHQENDGIGPYYTFGANSENIFCNNLYYCYEGCNEYKDQYAACGESFSRWHCREECEEEFPCDYSYQDVVYERQFYRHDSLSQAIEAYANLTYISKDDFCEMYLSNYGVVKCNERFLKNIVNTILEIKEDGNGVVVDAALPLPLIGTSMMYHTQNAASYSLVGNPTYKCNGEYEPYLRSWELELPYMWTQHSSWMEGSFLMQELPDRVRVRLLHMSNLATTLTTSAVIRKHLFVNSTDYSPWNFTYSISATEMPTIADPHVHEASVLSTNQMMMSMASLEYVTTGLFPMMHAALQLGREIEGGAMRLYQLHSVSPSLWVLSSTLYQLLICTIPILINLVAVLIFNSYMYFDNPNSAILSVTWFILQSYYSMPTGVLLAVIFRKGKSAAMTSFFFILLVIILEMFQYSSRVFSYILALFAPCQVMIYQQGLTSMGKRPDYLFLFYGTATALLQIGIAVLIMNFPLLKSRFQAKKYVPKNRSRSDSISSAISEASSVESSDTAIQVVNVSHTYDGKLYALKNVSLDIPSNHVFGLLGANGSGKSTLMHCLAGIYRPTEGFAFLRDGTNLFEMTTASKHFSIVPQLDILFEHLTVEEHLRIFLLLNTRSDAPSINSIISTMELQAYLHVKTGQLSGGIKRKLSFAIALAADPEIIALDEPSTGLGATTKRAVQDAVFALINTGKTVVLTSHDMEEVEMICGHCVVMKDGEVLSGGSVRKLRRNVQFDFELKIKYEQPEQQKALEDQFKMSLLNYTGKCNEICKFQSYTFEKGVARQEIIGALKNAGIDSLPWILETAKLESVFMDIVGAK